MSGHDHGHRGHDHHDDDGHDHGHAHGPGGHHDHQPPAGFDGAFVLGAVLNAGFVVAEVVFGLAAHSVALLADAAHNLGDVPLPAPSEVERDGRVTASPPAAATRSR
jgi:cobalt-zinc-cadmium efflux system protein